MAAMGGKRSLLVAGVESSFSDLVDVFHQVPVEENGPDKQPGEQEK